MINFLAINFSFEKNRKLEEYLRQRLEKERSNYIKKNIPIYLFYFLRLDRDKNCHEITNMIINTLETTVEDNVRNIMDFLAETNSEFVYYE